MHKNKVIILAIGTVILIALSITMFYLESQTPSDLSETNLSEADPEVTDDSNNSIENESSSSSPDGNINQAEDTIENDGETLSEEEQTDLQEYAIEAIEEANVNEQAEELSLETLYTHSVINQAYNINSNEDTLSSDNLDQEAEWISHELMGWKEHAEDNYSFEYSEDDFLNFINQENYLEEEDTSTIILLNELENVSENAYHRHLELLYLRPFIWSSIERDINDESENNESGDMSHFREFEHEVLEKIIEENPDLIDD